MKKKIKNDMFPEHIRDNKELARTTEDKRAELINAIATFELYKDKAIKFVQTKLLEAIYNNITNPTTLDSMSLSEQMKALRTFNKIISENEDREIKNIQHNLVKDSTTIVDVFK